MIKLKKDVDLLGLGCTSVTATPDEGYKKLPLKLHSAALPLVLQCAAVGRPCSEQQCS